MAFLHLNTQFNMPETAPDFVSIILKMLGGLSLFLYGVTLMGDTLKELSLSKHKE